MILLLIKTYVYVHTLFDYLDSLSLSLYKKINEIKKGLYKVLWNTFSPLFSSCPVFIIESEFQYIMVKNVVKHLHKYYFYAVTDEGKNFLKKNKINHLDYIFFPKYLVAVDFLNYDSIVNKKYTLSFESLLEIKQLKKIQLYHGVADKNWTYSYRNKYFDLLLVPGTYAKDKLRNIGISNKKIKVVGFSKFDEYMKNPKKRNYNNKARPTVLYAPTWGLIGSTPYVYKKLIELRNKYHFIYKPHRYIDWNYAEIFRNFGIEVSMCADITTLFERSDLMISDSSSAMFEFLITKKPIIALDMNTDLIGIPSTNSISGPEILFRNLFIRLKNINLLEEKIDNALKKNTINSETDSVIQSLFSPTYPAGEIAAKEILKFIEKNNN